MLGIWIGFNAFVLLMLALDLGVFHRKAHQIEFKEAMLWSLFWILLSLGFNAGVYVTMGKLKGVEFLTGYLIEKSLSVDNIFVFLMIFQYFAVPGKYQHRVLFFGIIGALIMRAIFIFSGVALLNRFHWLVYVFGAFLIYSGYKMAVQKGKKVEPQKNPLLRFLRQRVPITPDYVEGRFLVRQHGQTMGTPLLVVLIMVEATDLVFAIDSIPAILAVTRDPFIVYTSNVMAILGLRALFFALAGVMRLFYYLHYGLSAILVFVGAKMIASEFYHLPVALALGVVAAILSISILASLFFPQATGTHPETKSSP